MKKRRKQSSSHNLAQQLIRKVNPVVATANNMTAFSEGGRLPDDRPFTSPRSTEQTCKRDMMMRNTTLESSHLDVEQRAKYLSTLSADKIVEWAVDTFDNNLVLSSSFGIQAAVMLHLVTHAKPDIPVIWVDTGYLPDETYRFADELSTRLKLNLHVYQSHMTPAHMEATLGRLWESESVEDFDTYDYIRKVEPMNRALQDLNATAWLSGLRRDQTDYRKGLPHLIMQAGRYKVLPILNWNAKDIYQYLQRHRLPYHPYFDQGYVSVGDWHSSRPLTSADDHERDTRFQGLKQECGIHLPDNQLAAPVPTAA